jgi:hypothetical protein
VAKETFKGAGQDVGDAVSAAGGYVGRRAEDVKGAWRALGEKWTQAWDGYEDSVGDRDPVYDVLGSSDAPESAPSTFGTNQAAQVPAFAEDAVDAGAAAGRAAWATGEAAGEATLGASIVRGGGRRLLTSGPVQAALRRASPGVAFGAGGLSDVTGVWLRGTSGNVGLMPGQIARKLEGRQFTSFADFRQKFWLAVGEDEALLSQFTKSNQALIKQGKAPFVVADQVTGRGRNDRVYNLHHIVPIEEGGDVYDLNNIRIAAPRYHDSLHGQ